MALQSYHKAWLSKHPERDARWLQTKLSEGFDVHHLDGDHSNDDPANLVLIESGDHADLHGIPLKRRLSDGKDGRRAIRSQMSEARKADCKRAYEAKTRETTWREIATDLALAGVDPPTRARALAEAHAYANGLPWPKPESALPAGRMGLKKTNGKWMRNYGPHLPEGWPQWRAPQ